MSATARTIALKKTPQVPGLPLLGSLFAIGKGPADFFVHCYRTYGPVCRLSILGEKYVLISGVEAANFMGTRASKDCLRSKEFWEGLIGEYGEGQQIYEGEMIYIGTSVPHFMDEYWPKAKTFDIDRYQKPRAEHLQPGVYSPYGRGPHTCKTAPTPGPAMDFRVRVKSYRH